MKENHAWSLQILEILLQHASDEDESLITSGTPFSTPFNFRRNNRGQCSYRCGADMVTLYEALVADSILPLDQSVLGSMRAKIDEELKKLDEK
ncbi:hypothetical protein K1719_047539 [Acacia pycnantha]|nr:hypothetical protein K1719_047539 [Acacia pycnantha]